MRADKKFSEILTATQSAPKIILNNIDADTMKTQESKKMPFPLADSFSLILELIEYLKNPKTRDEITDFLDFDDRQTHLYASAVMYLGMIVKQDKQYELSLVGKQYMSATNQAVKNQILIQQILQHSVFRESFDYYREFGLKQARNKITELILLKVDSVNSKTTAIRRTNTVIKWLDWISSVTED